MFKFDDIRRAHQFIYFCHVYDIPYVNEPVATENGFEVVVTTAGKLDEAAEIYEWAIIEDARFSLD